MHPVSDILLKVKLGKISIDRAEKLLRFDTIAILGDVARIDTGRHLRRGVPEIIYAAGKSDSQLKTIVTGLLLLKTQNHESLIEPIIFSKVRGSDQAQVISDSVKSFNSQHKSNYVSRFFKEAKILTIQKHSTPRDRNTESVGRVALISAGTSDIHALNETEVILKILGCETIRFNDVGVAALHRLRKPLEKIASFDPDTIVVAAGMEGALPSVIAGLSAVPVIGLPTSIGYGYGGRGEAALMSMLQACSLGVCVVNIDAGIAAGVIAYLISRRSNLPRKKR